jgi:enamine deaminase RidA (YjgF/YER057c/UK114 family)
MKRQHVSSGSPWEDVVGYSRAVRAGNFVFVSGTTATGPDGKALSPDVYEQAREVYRRIASALTEVGATLQDVTLTRQYVVDISQWEVIGRAHGEVFGTIRPVTSMVEVSKLIDPSILIEIEVMAVIQSHTEE